MKLFILNNSHRNSFHSTTHQAPFSLREQDRRLQLIPLILTQNSKVHLGLLSISPRRNWDSWGQLLSQSKNWDATESPLDLEPRKFARLLL